MSLGSGGGRKRNNRMGSPGEAGEANCSVERGDAGPGLGQGPWVWKEKDGKTKGGLMTK